MANVMRHRFGAKNPYLVEVASATVVEVGDIISLVSNYAKTPAQGGSSAASLVATAETFLGVAMQASANGETTPIRVATSGVFEFPCASASVYLGLYAAVNGSALDQKVAVGALSSLSIGIALPNNAAGVGHGSNHTSVLVDIKPRGLGYSAQATSSAHLT